MTKRKITPKQGRKSAMGIMDRAEARREATTKRKDRTWRSVNHNQNLRSPTKRPGTFRTQG